MCTVSIYIQNVTRKERLYVRMPLQKKRKLPTFFLRLPCYVRCMQIWRSASLPHQLTNTWRLTGRHAVSTLSSLSPVQTGVLSHPLADHLIIELVRGQINIFFTSQFIFALVCQPSQRHASEAQNDCREWKGGEIHKWCMITERTQVSGEVWTSVTGKNRNTHTFSAPVNFLCVGGKQTPGQTHMITVKMCFSFFVNTAKLL